MSSALIVHTNAIIFIIASAIYKHYDNLIIKKNVLKHLKSKKISEETKKNNMLKILQKQNTSIRTIVFSFIGILICKIIGLITIFCVHYNV